MLPEKLEDDGIKGQAFFFLKSYLKNHNQKCKINGFVKVQVHRTIVSIAHHCARIFKTFRNPAAIC